MNESMNEKIYKKTIQTYIIKKNTKKINTTLTKIKMIFILI